MATYGQSNLGITVGGTEMKTHIQTINGLEIEALTEESDTFGDSWIENLYVGIRRAQPLVLGGFYDDTATTGPDAKFGTAVLGTTVAVVVTWGGTKTSTFSALVQKYKRTPVRGQLHKYEVTLLPSGAVTEA